MNNFFSYVPEDEVQDFEIIENLFGKKLTYASMGRFAIYHILKNIDTNLYGNKKVMMPVYACDSIAWAIEKAGFKPIYYDVLLEDFNADLEYIKRLYKETQSSILLVPSLYGNPANLIEIEQFCRDNNIFMIDDAAQAFGAKIGERMVGTFGNAGLFSFSAGKPTFGHMGGYFWVEDKPDLKTKRKNHRLYHYLNYINYFYNRYGDYNSKKLYKISLFNYFVMFLYKISNLENDKVYEYERKLHCKIALGNLNGTFSNRKDVFDAIRNILVDKAFRLVEPQRGVSNCNKIVIVAKTKQLHDDLKEFLIKSNIYCANGYRLLDDSGKYPVAKELAEKVIEIPIANDRKRNIDMIETIKKYINN